MKNRTIWQQAAGDLDRDYSGLCLEWDVILNGPGYAGPWPECQPLLERDGWSSRKLTDLTRFCEKMADGDLVVLRLGTSKVVGVGRIVGDYQWCEEFGDIDGWELQHVRRVRWLWQGEKSFATYDLKQGDTTQLLDSKAVTDWLESLDLTESTAPSRLVTLPAQVDGVSGDISIDEISEFLFDKGVASISIASLLNEIGELSRISNWYKRSECNPSEHETVSYLVTPLLRALGWTPQRMAIEWNRIDVALFKRLPRRDETLVTVVEAKKMDKSCLTAASQALSYATGRSLCRRLIVTDGLRYGVYVRNDQGQFDLYAYLNLTRLRRHYPVYACKGAEDALHAMSPDWDASEGV